MDNSKHIDDCPCAWCEVERQNAEIRLSDRIQQKMQPMILTTINQIGDYERAKGYLRYEMVRTLSLPTLHDLHARNMAGERWDDMIDAMIVGAEQLQKAKI